MLSSLLPGVREIRAPLVTGVLWLLALSVLVQGSVPPREQATGVYRLVYDLDALWSEVGVGVVVSLASYLLGTLSLALLAGGFPAGRLWRPAVRFVPRTALVVRGSRGQGRPPLRAPFGDRGHRVLAVVARDAVDRLRPVLAALAAAQKTAEASGDSSVETDAYYLSSFPTVSKPNVHHSALERVARTEISRRHRSSVPDSALIDRLVDQTGELSNVLRSAEYAYKGLGPKPESVPVRRSLRAAPTEYWSVEQPARSMLEEAVADLVVADFEHMRTRLLRPETRELSAAIDRLRNEAELRLAVIAPLVAFLCILAAKTDTPAWLAGLVAVVVLAREALQRRREAGDMLLDALGDRVESPALQRLDAEVRRVSDGLGG